MPGSPTEGAGTSPVTVSAEDYLWFVDRALSAMSGIVEELGDDLANRRPPLRGGNSAYVILAHCLGVVEYWGRACWPGGRCGATMRPSSAQR